MDIEPDLEICRSVMEGAKFAHFSIPNWHRQLLPVAKELGLIIACDIQDITSPDDSYRQDFIEQADILFFSAGNFEDPSPLMASFHQAKPEQIVIVGMGAKGCALGTSKGVDFFPAVDLAGPVIDTNGAGDSLAAGFLASYMLDGRTLTESIWRGQIAARHACTLRASSSELVTRQRLDSYYQELDQSDFTSFNS
jgi:sugar/nucleoside kinase (ribokinase family)